MWFLHSGMSHFGDSEYTSWTLLDRVAFLCISLGGPMCPSAGICDSRSLCFVARHTLLCRVRLLQEPLHWGAPHRRRPAFFSCYSPQRTHSSCYLRAPFRAAQRRTGSRTKSWGRDFWRKILRLLFFNQWDYWVRMDWMALMGPLWIHPVRFPQRRCTR